ncbi:AGC protein kinase [Spizellomyces punctatus DAOM BR117]|uniref:AGC protein kinase n=1 Tax=Spizellomyces punctatus (strain DAOM BR117) TaxID=645134 RepID=A0A0L0H5L7_SPIPD|nr:AGC protein kinase [Spizellomyces punctatus DAOM BR117]KNC96196.1 AGC protein kinase [Spizellomyces punctatus DAOM BR117]|eukprot:XP_016604236.1 AGC protein kinase [Spizellomyces punctatus DAOM BR117]
MRTGAPARGLSLPSLTPLEDTKSLSVRTQGARTVRPALQKGVSISSVSERYKSQRISAGSGELGNRTGYHRPASSSSFTAVSVSGDVAGNRGKPLTRAVSISGSGTGPSLSSRRRQSDADSDSSAVASSSTLTSPSKSTARLRQATSTNRLYAGRPAITKQTSITQPPQKSNYVTDVGAHHSSEDFHVLRTVARDGLCTTVLSVLKSDIESACSWYTSPAPIPRTCAIKMFRKTNVVQRKALQRLQRERDVLVKARQDLQGGFVVTLLGTWQNSEHVFMALDWGPIDLREVLRVRRRFDEESARFYIAEVTVALEFLHEKNILFRDLKPESILVDDDGHVKLCDFGLAKSIPAEGSTSTFCGTPGYMAPEILTKSHYSTATDWWSLGIVLYEMLVGDVPYGRDPDPYLTVTLIATTALTLPDTLSQPGRDLVKRLLHPVPRERLGSWHGSEDVKCHGWFRSIKTWRGVVQRNLEPPWVPDVDWEVAACIENRLLALRAGNSDDMERKKEAGLEVVDEYADLFKGF